LKKVQNKALLIALISILSHSCRLVQSQIYKTESDGCPSIVLKKNGKFYFTKTTTAKKQKGTWKINSDTLGLYYEYEIYKENKGKKYTNFESPGYRLIKESKNYLIDNETVTLIPNSKRGKKDEYGSYKYYGCYVFTLEK